jgi:hypothetical protein
MKHAGQQLQHSTFQTREWGKAAGISFRWSFGVSLSPMFSALVPSCRYLYRFTKAPFLQTNISSMPYALPQHAATRNYTNGLCTEVTNEANTVH